MTWNLSSFLPVHRLKGHKYQVQNLLQSDEASTLRLVLSSQKMAARILQLQAHPVTPCLGKSAFPTPPLPAYDREVRAQQVHTMISIDVLRAS